MSPDLINRPDEARALLEFARPAAVPGGFAWLDDPGAPDLTKPIHLWITGRMTHAFSLGHLLGVPGCGDLAAHGVAALAGPLRDPDFPGWLPSLSPDGVPSLAPKLAYDHAFVVLAASSALAAGVDGAAPLLDDALDVLEELWWDEEYGTVVDARSRDGVVVDPYRGANANMHTLEALLAAVSAGADEAWLRRAVQIAERFAGEFENYGMRLPEHYNEQWLPLMAYNRDKPADPFRPFGATPGHAFEWARLMVSLAAELRYRGWEVPGEFVELPQEMYDQARTDGWARDGASGFVYTTDFDGVPVVRQRMHWVVCEAIGAAEALRGVVGPEERAGLEADIAEYWSYAERYLIERPGAWRHELNPDNSPAGSGTWAGKPDIYHALQACLVGDLPARPSFAWALASRG